MARIIYAFRRKGIDGGRGGRNKFYLMDLTLSSDLWHISPVFLKGKLAACGRAIKSFSATPSRTPACSFAFAKRARRYGKQGKPDKIYLTDLMLPPDLQHISPVFLSENWRRTADQVNASRFSPSCPPTPDVASRDFCLYNPRS